MPIVMGMTCEVMPWESPGALLASCRAGIAGRCPGTSVCGNLHGLDWTSEGSGIVLS